jgi:hypothetical protein
VYAISENIRISGGRAKRKREREMKKEPNLKGLNASL